MRADVARAIRELETEVDALCTRIRTKGTVPVTMPREAEGMPVQDFPAWSPASDGRNSAGAFGVEREVTVSAPQQSHRFVLIAIVLGSVVIAAAAALWLWLG